MAVLNGKATDRFPVDIWYTKEVGCALKKYYNVHDDLELYDIMGVDKIVWIFPDYRESDEGPVSGSQVGAKANGERTMWGVPLKAVQSGKATYHEFGEPPLKGYDIPASLDDYPYWPDPEKIDYENAKKEAQIASGKYATIGPWISFFEIYCQMRGLEQSLMDLVLEPELATAILDEIESRQAKMLERFLSELNESIDLVFISDDMGMQQNLLVSPGIWERFFKERMQRCCDLVHSYKKKVFYHSDGAVELLIPELLDCGIDVLNPVQHVCPGMDMMSLKKKYGNRVVFHGGIDNQSVLPFGTPDDVRKETRNCLKTLGADGKGYIVCSCHNMQAGTPVENAVAMVDCVQNHVFENAQMRNVRSIFIDKSMRNPKKTSLLLTDNVNDRI